MHLDLSLVLSLLPLAAAAAAREPLPPVGEDDEGDRDLPPPPHFLPCSVAAVEYPIDLADYGSAPSSQDFRDEVDALL